MRLETIIPQLLMEEAEPKQTMGTSGQEALLKNVNVKQFTEPQNQPPPSKPNDDNSEPDTKDKNPNLDSQKKNEEGDNKDGNKSDPVDPFAEVTLETITDEQIESLETTPEEELTEGQKRIIKEIEESQQKDGDGENDVISPYLEELGLDNEDGRYTNDIDGIKSAAKDFSTKYVQENMESAIQQYFKQYPHVYDVYKHTVVDGFGMDSFMKQATGAVHENFNISEEEGQIGILKYDLNQKGISEDDAKVIIDNKKKNGNLEDDAKKVFKSLKSNYEREVEEQKQKEAEQRQLQAKQAEERAKEVSSIIENGKIGAVKLSPSEQQEFRDFEFGVNEEGIPNVQNAYANATTEQKLLIDYLLYKNFNVQGLTSPQKLRKLTFDKKKFANSQQQNQQPDDKTQPKLRNLKIDLSKVKTAG